MHGVDVETQPVVDAVLVALDQNDFERCATLLEQEIERHNESALIDFLLKSVLFWRKRMGSTSSIPKRVDRARYLLTEWKKYHALFHEDEEQITDFDRYLFVFRKAISKIVLFFLRAALNDPFVNESQVYLCMARAHKGAGNYEQAIIDYRRVIAQAEQCAAAYAELGDCYLLIGNEGIGRLFLREAFYIDPDGIAFDFLESELLTTVLSRLRDTETMEEDEYRRWLPVYAVLWDAFTTKRELKTAEYGMLRQRIYALEREYSESKNPLLEPRLLYAYFYLLDYYHRTDHMQMNVDEIIMKIKGINPKICTLYTERNQL